MTQQPLHAKDDLVGHVFGRLTVVSLSSTIKGRRYWKCQCSCGKTKDVAASNLKAGHVKSCGCINAIHGGIVGHGNRHPLYMTWTNMLKRCHNPTDAKYPIYGGRGIIVCATWKDFMVFIKDVPPKPSPELQLDRIDNNGNYEPGNVRWAMRKEQGANKRDNRLITAQGLTLTVTQWAERTGIKRATLFSRLKYGWNDEDVVTPRPVR